jgi:hypothetical protein
MSGLFRDLRWILMVPMAAGDHEDLVISMPSALATIASSSAKLHYTSADGGSDLPARRAVRDFQTAFRPG